MRYTREYSRVLRTMTRKNSDTSKRLGMQSVATGHGVAEHSPGIPRICNGIFKALPFPSAPSASPLRSRPMFSRTRRSLAPPRCFAPP